jgi:hypothetical protein
MAVSVKTRSSFFMHVSKNPICTGSERGPRNNGEDAIVKLHRLRLPSQPPERSLTDALSALSHVSANH